MSSIIQTKRKIHIFIALNFVILFTKSLILFLLLTNQVNAYDRKSYGGWQSNNISINNKNLKCNTMNVLLILNSTKEVELTRKCNILSGEWISFYSHRKIYERKYVQIDHLVPVSYIDKNCGGKNWSFKEKRKFYNDFENLVISSSKENRKKSDILDYENFIFDKNIRNEYLTKKNYILNKYCVK